MSGTASPPKAARFIFRWKLDWSKFANELSIYKRLITVFNNVPLYLEALLTKEGGQTWYEYELALVYTDGPSSDLRILNISLKDLTNVYVQYAPFSLHRDGDGLVYDFSISRGTRDKLIATDQLFCEIDLKIPVSAFKFILEAPVPAPSTPWISELFKCIDDREKSVYSNATVTSSDGASFYCHQLIFQCQSEALAAILRHPPAEGQREREYRFPALNSVALKALLEFLYTGKVNAAGLCIAYVSMECIALADAAEQYGLKKLKETCAAFLWKQAVDKPADCVEIIRFCDLHDDLKLVKRRAIAVLDENYETLQLHTGELAAKFGGGMIGTELASEVYLFMRHRVEPVEIV